VLISYLNLKWVRHEYRPIEPNSLGPTPPEVTSSAFMPEPERCSI
jgi:hypothetical protein